MTYRFQSIEMLHLGRRTALSLSFSLSLSFMFPFVDEIGRDKYAFSVPGKHCCCDQHIHEEEEEAEHFVALAQTSV